MSYIRPAGLNERRCIARDSLGLYGSIVTVVTYSRRSTSTSQRFSKYDLFKVLEACVSEHPVLSTVVQDAESERPMLASVAQVDLRNHLCLVDEDEGIAGSDGENTSKRMQRLLERAHNDPFTDYDSVPAWRVYIFYLQAPTSSSSLSEERFYLAFSHSHALADGVSGLAFHATFAKTLVNTTLVESGSESDPIWTVNPSNNLLPPPLEQAATFPISWSFLLRPALNEFLPPWLTSVLGVKDTSAEGAWCGAAIRPSRNGRTELISTAVRVVFIPQATMQQVLRTCKKHNARFTGLITHLTARSLSQALRARNQHFETFLADIAIDLRRCIPSASGRMANYTSATTIILSTPSSEDSTSDRLTDADWEAIHNTTTNLASRSNTLEDQPVALLKYVPKIRNWVTKQADKAADSSFGVSNLGVWPRNLSNSSGDEWDVENVTFSQSADGMGQPFNVNVVSHEGGPTAVVVSWWPGMLGVDEGDAGEGEGRFIQEVLDRVLWQMEMI